VLATGKQTANSHYKLAITECKGDEDSGFAGLEDKPEEGYQCAKLDP
jgi:hypothetical protein